MLEQSRQEPVSDGAAHRTRFDAEIVPGVDEIPPSTATAAPPIGPRGLSSMQVGAVARASPAAERADRIAIS